MNRFPPVSAYDAAAWERRTQAAFASPFCFVMALVAGGFLRSLALLHLALPGDEQAGDDGYALHHTSPSIVSSRPPPRPSPRPASSPSTPISRPSSTTTPM